MAVENVVVAIPSVLSRTHENLAGRMLVDVGLPEDYRRKNLAGRIEGVEVLGGPFVSHSPDQEVSWEEVGEVSVAVEPILEIRLGFVDCVAANRMVFEGVVVPFQGHK